MRYLFSSFKLITQFHQVHQRVYDWRGAIGSHALRAFEAFFKSNPSRFPDLETRSAYCTAVLLPVRVFYADPDAQYQYVCTVLFICDVV